MVLCCGSLPPVVSSAAEEDNDVDDVLHSACSIIHIPPFAFPFFLTEDSTCMVSGFSPSGEYGTTGNNGVVTLHPVSSMPSTLLAFFQALHYLITCMQY